MAKKIRSKISKALEQKLKETLPEGHALSVDRRHTIQDEKKVLDPSKPENIRKWKDKTHRYDIDGFDTADAREPSQKEVRREVLDRPSGEQVMLDEPDRLVKPDSVAGRLIEDVKDKIFDFQSFKTAVKQSWGTDGSLANLVNNARGDDGYMELFKNPVIQGYLNENTKPLMVNYLMKRFGIEPVRASNVINKLPASVKSKLYRKARDQSLPRIRQPKSRTVRSRTTTASQSRPARMPRWTQQEQNIIKANIRLSPERLTELLKQNTNFNRTFSSVKNKLYRIRRESA